MQAGSNANSSCQLNVPPIVRVVLSQMAKMRSTGSLDERTFELNLQRLTREELMPRGLRIAIHELPGGRTRFVIEAKKSAEFCEWVE